MRKTRILAAALVLISAVPAFATGHCGNDPTKPDPVPFKCNGVEQLPLSSRKPMLFIFNVEPPPPFLLSIEVENPRVIAGSPTRGIVTADHAVKYDYSVTLTIDPQTTAVIPDHVTIT